MKKFVAAGLSVVLVTGFVMGCSSLSLNGASSGTFTLWQLPNQTKSQMMSYVLRSVNGKLVVIDGGTAGDAAYLRAFLKEHGGHVEAWFLTHPHSDHCDALCEILREPEGIEIGTLYTSLPDSVWVEELADASEKTTYATLQKTLLETKRAPVEVALGQKLEIGGILIEVLGVKNPDIRKNPINNSCMVLRVSDKHKSVLFLADSGFEEGQKLLQGEYADRVPSDYVQMAHHGQNGVGQDVYAKIQPKYCLWPTPLWLWDNDTGAGKGSGHWKTLEVRAWMDPMGIKKHYLMFEGLQKIE